MSPRYRILLFTFVAVALAVPVSAQRSLSSVELDVPLFFLPHAHPYPALSGRTLSTTFDVSVADLGAVNPAALGAFGWPEAGLSYRVETSIEEAWIGGGDYDAENGARPQTAAVVVPVGSFRFGAAYAQRYAGTLDYGTIPVRTIENPDGDPALSISMSETARVETVSPMIAVRLADALGVGDALTLGARLSVGWSSYESVTARVSNDSTLGRNAASDRSTHLAVGVRYEPGTARPFGVGLYYEGPLRFESIETRSFPDLGVEGPGGIETPDQRVPFAGTLPGRLGLSAQYTPTPTFRVGADIARVFWKGAGEQRRNQFEASVWTQRDVAEGALVSFGVFSQGRAPFESADILDYSGRAIYLTAGGALTFDRLRLEVVAADSRLLSAEQHRQTIVKVGASVQL